jgi:hypothetical protein
LPELFHSAAGGRNALAMDKELDPAPAGLHRGSWYRGAVRLLAFRRLELQGLMFQQVRRYSVGEDLWFGRITAGQDLRALTAAHLPRRVLRRGSYTVLCYYSDWPLPPMSIPMEGLCVIAKEGKLVHASVGGCTWHRVFFDMSPEDEVELKEEWRRYFEQKEKSEHDS